MSKPEPKPASQTEQPRAAHTPAPWEVCRAVTPTDGEFDFGIAAKIEGGSVCIAEVFGRVAIDIRPAAEANAHLIAAAPELLSALQAIVEEIRAYQSPECDDDGAPGAAELKAADAAIAKATGAQP